MLSSSPKILFLYAILIVGISTLAQGLTTTQESLGGNYYDYGSSRIYYDNTAPAPSH